MAMARRAAAASSVVKHVAYCGASEVLFSVSHRARAVFGNPNTAELGAFRQELRGRADENGAVDLTTFLDVALRLRRRGRGEPSALLCIHAAFARRKLRGRREPHAIAMTAGSDELVAAFYASLSIDVDEKLRVFLEFFGGGDIEPLDFAELVHAALCLRDVVEHGASRPHDALASLAAQFSNTLFASSTVVSMTYFSAWFQFAHQRVASHDGRLSQGAPPAARANLNVATAHRSPPTQNRTTATTASFLDRALIRGSSVLASPPSPAPSTAALASAISRQ